MFSISRSKACGNHRFLKYGAPAFGSVQGIFGNLHAHTYVIEEILHHVGFPLGVGYMGSSQNEGPMLVTLDIWCCNIIYSP